MMHVYLMAVRHYFTGEEFFRVSAQNKTDALDLGKKFVIQSPKYSPSNYDLGSVRVVRKEKSNADCPACGFRQSGQIES